MKFDYLKLTCYMGWTILLCRGEKNQYSCKDGVISTNRRKGLPYIKEMNCMTSRLAGDHLVMTCQVLANPPARITWQHNGKTLTSSGFCKIDHLSCNQRVDIELVMKEHDGSYTCTAKNSYGSTNNTCNIGVHDPTTDPLVYGGIALNGKCPRKMEDKVLVGSTLNMTCTVYYKKTIYWRKDGEIFTAHPRHQGPSSSTIMFSRVNESDRGNYTCVARGHSNQQLTRSIYLNTVHALPIKGERKRSKAAQAGIQLILYPAVLLFFLQV